MSTKRPGQLVNPGRRSSRDGDLPGWPLALPFVAYPLAWVIGIGDLIWPLAGALAAATLIHARHRIEVPRGFGIWLLFLAWMLASFIQLDSPSRAIGFTYRAGLYLAATALAVYAYNARRTVTIRYACGVLTIFLLIVTVGGLLAAVAPLWTFRTPMSFVIPAGLQDNELIGEMVVRRMTQYDPEAWSAVAPRPSAPFIYTNTWGNVYSLLLPIAGLYAWLSRGTRRSRWTVVLIVVSIVPAVLTLNRGMFAGLGVAAAYLAVQSLRAGRLRELTAGAAVGVVAIAAWLASPTAADLTARVEVGSSTQDRATLYGDTFQAALNSPLFGYGAPRDAELPWLPPLGTQGQLWTVLFSHGFIATALFLGWFIWALLAISARTDRTSTVLGAVIAATLVETVFYGMMTGLNVSLLISVLALRWTQRPSDEETAPSEPEIATTMRSTRTGTRRVQAR